MKMRLSGERKCLANRRINKRKNIRTNKRGSSLILLSMVFVTISSSIAASIEITRAMVVKSECEVFGEVWSKAILSEYDRHLFEDYGIQAFYGSEKDVQKRLDAYILYSCSGKLDSRIGKSEAFLTGYELSDPENFRKQLKLSIPKSRTNRENPLDNIGKRRIANELVINTLPSRGTSEAIDIETITEKLKSIESADDLLSNAKGDIKEWEFISNNLSNCLSYVGNNDSYFQNEWEYLVAGKLDDEANYKACRRRIYLIRNALNLVALYKDTAKVEAITAIAELITPGAGSLTQVIIAEAWAAIETEEDLKALYSGERVPLIKTNGEWKTDLDSVLDSSDFAEQIGEEARENLETNKEEISEKISGIGTGSTAEGRGASYEDYLQILLFTMNGNIRTLRIMDIIQINMKFKYYDDFNMEEYYIGVNFNIHANGKDYEFEESYK